MKGNKSAIDSIKGQAGCSSIPLKLCGESSKCTQDWATNPKLIEGNIFPTPTETEEVGSMQQVKICRNLSRLIFPVPMIIKIHLYKFPGKPYSRNRGITLMLKVSSQMSSLTTQQQNTRVTSSIQTLAHSWLKENLHNLKILTISNFLFQTGKRETQI